MNRHAPAAPGGNVTDLWVFGYGSLMWKPGFAYEEAVPALLPSAHRSLCVYSVVHRGSRRYPGLVLGLDVGGPAHDLQACLGNAAGDEYLIVVLLPG
jgi:cation transport protein ChaC